MITRNFNLYLNAGHSVPLVINVNQYDSGEQWVFTLYNADSTKYTPSTGAIIGIKADGLGIINSGSVVDGNVVINETQQMTAAVGKAVFELMIDSQTHGTANFVVLVEEKPGNNADLSESDLSLLQEAIDATSPLPTGGSVGQVLTKTANGSAWSDAGTPTQEQVADAVSDWADEHITVETGVVIDTSLSVAGAAADAKKTGDEITDLKSAFIALKDFLNHLNASFDDENGDTYIQNAIDAIDAIGTGGGDDPTPPTPEPIVPLTFCSTPFSNASTHLYTDEGTTLKTDLKSSAGIYYYLDEVTTEDTVYDVKISVNTNLNTHQYKAMYAYSAQLLSGAGTNDPTIYDITNLEQAGIFDASRQQLTGDSVYETQMTVKAERQLAVLFYRNQSTCINSITAQKVVN